ncbi:MAG: aminoacyltransferase [Firmicutes bacterium]|nr:aminoacyltransferase [Bacillota bacterium]
MYIKELTNEEFNSFSNSFKDKSIYQTSEYAEIMKKQEYHTILVGLMDDTKILAASLILVERRNNFKYAYAPRGFLLDYSNYHLLEAFTFELKKFLGKMDIVAIKLSPMIIKNIYNSKGELIEENSNFNSIYENLKGLDYYHYGYNNFFESHKPRYEGILDIKKNYLLLFRNIKKEFRTKIRSAEKKGISIIQGNKEELNYLIKQVNKKYPRNENYFYDTYDAFSTRNMIDYYYAKLDTKTYLEVSKKQFEQAEANNNKINNEVIKNAGKNSSKLLSKKIDSDNLLSVSRTQLVKATNLLRDLPEGVVIATSLVIRHQDQVFMFMDGFDSEFKSINAKHLLMWKLIEKYSRLGFTKFNLGGMTNIQVKHKKYDGLNEFKQNFNSNIIEYIGDLELITNNTLYFMYKKSLQIKRILNK